jgi:transketolase
MTPGGVTHQAIEDIAIMRAIPNMTVLEIGDATEAQTVHEVAHNIDGPVYIRALRGEVSRLFPSTEGFEFNRARQLSYGTDLTVITSGIMTEEALRAVPALQSKGVSVRHLHVSTLKPFTDPQVVDAVTTASKGVITMENHSTTGGLGSAVAELMAEHGARVPLRRVGINDTYAHGASQKYLMAELGLDSMALVSAAEDLLGEKLSLDAGDLAEVREVSVHSQAKAEAL